MIKVGFPGLGIGDFNVNSDVFEEPLFGVISIKWYGLIIALGMVLAFVYAGYRAKKNDIKFDDVIDLGLFAVIFGVIGARLYYVISEVLAGKGDYNSFYDVIAIWEGGLAIYGGVIGGAIAVFITAKIKKMNFPLCADIILPGVMIAQSLGRWGNFFNGEAHGGIVSPNSPLYFLRMRLNQPHNVDVVNGMAEVHPTFLYESVWNLVGFILINILWNKGKKKFDGEVGLWYVAWYGFGRMFIEQLRTDSLGNGGNFRVSQVLALVSMLVAVGVIVWRRIVIAKEAKAVASCGDLSVNENKDITDEKENENG